MEKYGKREKEYEREREHTNNIYCLLTAKIRLTTYTTTTTTTTTLLHCFTTSSYCDCVYTHVYLSIFLSINTFYPLPVKLSIYYHHTQSLISRDSITLTRSRARILKRRYNLTPVYRHARVHTRLMITDIYGLENARMTERETFLGICLPACCMLTRT